MQPRFRFRGPRLAVITIVMLAIVLAGRPAGAGVHVFVGGGFGVPVYHPPCAYPYYPYPYPVVPPPYAVGLPPPPAWAPGHWEWRYDPWGRPIQVWIPAYLR